MNPTYDEFSSYMSKVYSNPMLPYSSQFPETPNDYQFNQSSTDFDLLSHQFSVPPESDGLVPPASVGKDGESLYHDGNSLHFPTTASHEAADSYDDEGVFKFLNQMLMEEEDIEPNHTMMYDPLAFRVTERSFYDILGQQYPVTPTTQQSKQPLFVDQASQQPLYDDQDVKNLESFFSGSSSDVNSSSSPSTGPINLADSRWLTNYGDDKLSLLQTRHPSDSVSKFNYSSGTNLQPYVHPRNGRSAFGETIPDSLGNQFLAHNIFTDNDSILQFHRGLEEASKFLPKVNQLVINLENNKVSAHAPTLTDKKDMNEMMNSSNKRRGRRNSPIGSAERKKSPNNSRGRKHHELEDMECDEVRRRKQSAIYNEIHEEEDELSELFDKVLLFKHDDTSAAFDESVDVKNEKSKSSLENGQQQASNGGCAKTRTKKQGKKKEIVDLKKLLILCAQAVSTNDFKTSTGLLKQIRQLCSPFGNGSERLAHYFANGLEARMAGDVIKLQIRYDTISSKLTTTEKLKSQQFILSSSPIHKVSIFFTHEMILKMAENATTLHIVAFGIMFGFSWPIIIHKLSKRPGGPPKLRITGIDVPQDGFRPTEWIEETGRRLEKCCARFKVPFEFNAIVSQQWESIRVEDLKVVRNEKLAVNCTLRFKNLMDEAVEGNSPRDSVLKLIRSLNPDIVVHRIINGAYNSPFFVTRFREALFFYSTIFDYVDVTMPNSPERFHIEKELFGVEVMNVVACEGADRNERPETYKQSQVRMERAGLKLLPLDPEITKSYMNMCKEKYHKDFKILQSGDWLLQGWKGRIIHANSCWVPA